MEIHDTSEFLPEPDEWVLGYYNRGNWGSNGTNHGRHNWCVVKFCQGKTAEELDPYKGIRACDQDGNNLEPYCWDEYGLSKHFGQEITRWAYLPDPQ